MHYNTNATAVIKSANSSISKHCQLYDTFNKIIQLLCTREVVIMHSKCCNECTDQIGWLRFNGAFNTNVLISRL